MLAAEKNFDRVVDVLIDAGADKDARDKDGRTALMLAALVDADAAVKALLAKGAGVDVADAEGDTALLLAARRGSLKALQRLCKAGADFFKTADGGSRAFDAARQCTHPDPSVGERAYDLLLDEDLDREDAAK